MAPRKYQKVELAPSGAEVDSSPAAPTTQVNNTDKPKEMKYGERVEIVNTPYRDSPSYFPSLNVTCNPRELQLSLRKQREDCAKTVAENQEFRRVPKGERTLTHKLPEEETTTTKRLEH